MKEKLLIVNADDFGWSRGITDGILEAHRHGIVTSTSLMVNQPASEFALDQMPTVPTLGVGIHLTLCDGAPVLPPETVPSLVTPDGTFYSASEAIRKLRRRHFAPRDIEAEFRAQIQWMKTRGGVPTHADSHHNLHHYPSAIYAFRRAMKAEGINRVRSARATYFPRDGHLGAPHAGSAYRRLMVSAYNTYAQYVILSDLQWSDYCVVCHPKFRGELSLLDKGLQMGLENLKPGTCEMICHPGLSEVGFSEGDRIREKRELELRLLTGLRYKTIIEKNNIRLISYAQL
jgi:chitin disaccharide deacetylase